MNDDDFGFDVYHAGYYIKCKSRSLKAQNPRIH